MASSVVLRGDDMVVSSKSSTVTLFMGGANVVLLKSEISSLTSLLGLGRVLGLAVVLLMYTIVVYKAI